MTNEESESICRKAAEGLGEHYDAVQILTTWNEDGITKRTYIGAGNVFSRIGMAHDYLTDMEQDDLSGKLANAIATKEGWDEDDD